MSKIEKKALRIYLDFASIINSKKNNKKIEIVDFNNRNINIEIKYDSINQTKYNLNSLCNEINELNKKYKFFNDSFKIQPFENYDCISLSVNVLNQNYYVINNMITLILSRCDVISINEAKKKFGNDIVILDNNYFAIIGEPRKTIIQYLISDEANHKIINKLDNDNLDNIDLYDAIENKLKEVISEYIDENFECLYDIENETTKTLKELDMNEIKYLILGHITECYLTNNRSFTLDFNDYDLTNVNLSFYIGETINFITNIDNISKLVERIDFSNHYNNVIFRIVFKNFKFNKLDNEIDYIIDKVINEYYSNSYDLRIFDKFLYIRNQLYKRLIEFKKKSRVFEYPNEEDMIEICNNVISDMKNV